MDCKALSTTQGLLALDAFWSRRIAVRNARLDGERDAVRIQKCIAKKRGGKIVCEGKIDKEIKGGRGWRRDLAQTGSDMVVADKYTVTGWTHTIRCRRV